MPTPFSPLRALVAAALASPLLACNPGDLGSPCNHGTVDPPSTKLVTFPALSCDDLLCVYGEEKEIPSVACTTDEQCNEVGSEKIFECDTENEECTLSLNYVLKRSMCSKRCSTDDDCKDQGATKRVVAKDTACETGFACARIQQLGEFCCERLCVCNDELPSTVELDENCSTDSQPGCCVDDEGKPIANKPKGCGIP